MLTLTYLALCSRLTLGITFAASGVAKVVSFRGFRVAVAEFHLLPARLVGLFAGLIVLAELAAAVLLVSGMAVELGLAVAVALLLIFTIALVRVLRRGQDVAWRCFGQWSAGVLDDRRAGCRRMEYPSSRLLGTLTHRYSFGAHDA